MRYKFRQWVDQRTNEKVFSSHYDRLGDQGQAACDTRMMYLRDQPPNMWVDPQARKLSWKSDKNCKDIYEIRFVANRLQQRPMGYFGPGSDEFTVVIWVTHKGDQYKPRDFCRIASERWSDVKSNPSVYTCEIEID